MLRPFRILLSTLFWTFAVAVPLTALALAALTDVGSGIMASPLLAVAVILIVAHAVRVVRRRRVSAVLMYLEQAMRLNLPLPRMLAAAERGEKIPLRDRLGHLQELLGKGMLISDALPQAVPETSWRTIGLVRCGERIGRLPRVLGQLVDEDRRRQSWDPSRRVLLTLYPVMMIMVMLVIFSLLPQTLFRILVDFHVPLSPVARIVLYVWRVAMPVAALAMFCVLTVFFLWTAWEWWRLRTGAPRFRLGWFTRHRDLADVCHVLADAMEAGLPLDAAILDAANLGIGFPLRRKLKRWAAGLERGIDPAQAARNAGMPKLIAGMMSGATSTDAAANGPEVFRFLFRYYSDRFSRLCALARGAVIPIFALIFGAIVVAVALSLLLPLLELAGSIGPYRVSL